MFRTIEGPTGQPKLKAFPSSKSPAPSTTQVDASDRHAQDTDEEGASGDESGDEGGEGESAREGVPIENMKVPELREALRTLGLSIKGVKSELIERLLDARYGSEGGSEADVGGEDLGRGGGGGSDDNDGTLVHTCIHARMDA